MCVAVLVFLIHGMGRSRTSMLWMSRQLVRAGHRTSSFGYAVSRSTMQVIATNFAAHVDEHAGCEPTYAVVGHSLGNIITRMALPQLTRLTRFVMLAPPNQPPVMAHALRTSAVFRALTKDAGAKLQDHAFYRTLPVPRCPSLVVAGTRGPRARFLPFAGEASDGVVRVVETQLPGSSHVQVAAVHTFIMNHRDVVAHTLRFLAAPDPMT